VNDAERLAHDPALRWVVGGRAVTQNTASASQMGRFETEVLTQEANLSALADLSGCWIDRVHARRPVKGIVLDMDSSVSQSSDSFPDLETGPGTLDIEDLEEAMKRSNTA
jgi:hypothetical protein